MEYFVVSKLVTTRRKGMYAKDWSTSPFGHFPCEGLQGHCHWFAGRKIIIRILIGIVQSSIIAHQRSRITERSSSGFSLYKAALSPIKDIKIFLVAYCTIAAIIMSITRCSSLTAFFISECDERPFAMVEAPTSWRNSTTLRWFIIHLFILYFLFIIYIYLFGHSVITNELA